MSTNVGSIRAVVEVDTSRVRAGLAGVDARLGKTEASLRSADAAAGRMTRGLSNLGKTALMAGGFGLAAIGGYALKSAVDFETSMAKIEGLVGRSKAEVESYTQAVRTMAVEHGKSATEAADAMFYITSAGLKGADATDALNASLKGSAIGLGDTATVANAVTSAMNAYKASGLSAGKATDLLTAAVREGKLEASELAPAMGKVLPLASAMGVGFEEVTAAFAAMSRTGTNAYEAATQIRAIMGQLAKPTTEAKNTLGEYGFTADQVRKDLSKDFLGTLEKLLGAMEGNDEALTSVFGNIRALSGVLDMTGDNIDATREIFGSLKGAVGSTDKAFDVMKETAGYKFSVAMAKARESMMQFGEAALPVLTSVTSALSSIAAPLSMLGSGLGKVTSGLSAFGGESMLVTAGLGAFLGSSDKATAAMGRWSTSVKSSLSSMAGFRGMLSSMKGGLVGLGIGVAVGGLMTLGQRVLPAVKASFTGAKTEAQKFREELMSASGATAFLNSTSQSLTEMRGKTAQATQARRDANQALREAQAEYSKTKAGTIENAIAADKVAIAEGRVAETSRAVTEAKRQETAMFLEQGLALGNIANGIDTAISKNTDHAAASLNAAGRVNEAQDLMAKGNAKVAQSANFKNAQKEVDNLATSLQKAGAPKALVDELQRLSKLKSPKEFADGIREVEGKVNDFIKSTPGAKANKDLTKIADEAARGKVKGNMGYLDRVVGTGMDTVIKTLREKAGIAKGITEGVPLRSSPSVLPNVRQNMEALEGVVAGGFDKTLKAASDRAGRIKNRIADVIGSFSGGTPGVRTSISTIAEEGILVDPAIINKAIKQAARLEALRNKISGASDKDKKSGQVAKWKKQAAALKGTVGNTAQSLAAIVNAHEVAKDKINKAVDGWLNGRLKEIDAAYADRVEGVGAAARIIPGHFRQLQNEIDASLKGVQTTTDARMKAVEKALRGTLVDNLGQIGGQFAERIRALKSQYDALDALRDPKNLTAGEAALKAAEDAAKADDRAAADRERNLRKEEESAKLAEALRWGDAASAADARRALADIEAEEARLAREDRIEELRKTAEAEREQRNEDIQTQEQQLQDAAASLREDISANATAERDAINANGEARRLLLQNQQAAEQEAARQHAEKMKAEMLKVPQHLTRTLTQGKNVAKAFAHSMSGWGNRAGRYFVEQLSKGMKGLKGAVANSLRAGLEDYLKLNSPAKKGPLSEVDTWWTALPETLMDGVKPPDMSKALRDVSAPRFDAGRAGAAVVINLTVTDQTFAGMSREQADKVARQVRDAMDRQVRITV